MKPSEPHCSRSRSCPGIGLTPPVPLCLGFFKGADQLESDKLLLEKLGRQQMGRASLGESCLPFPSLPLRGMEQGCHSEIHGVSMRGQAGLLQPKAALL